MKKLMFIVSLMILTNQSYGANIYVGDTVALNSVSVSSTAFSSVCGYSNGRVIATVVNNDTTNSVLISTSTGANASFPLAAKGSVQIFTHAALFGEASPGISASTISCIQEY